MTIREFVTTSLTVVQFDDGLHWVHVDLQRAQNAAKTLYQTRAQQQLTDEELDRALVVLDDLANVWVNRYRRTQATLF